MPVEIPLPVATRESAATIARMERAAQRRRDRSLLAADVERVAGFILGDEHDAAIAEQSLDRVDPQIRTPHPSAEGFSVVSRRNVAGQLSRKDFVASGSHGTNSKSTLGRYSQRISPVKGSAR